MANTSIETKNTTNGTSQALKKVDADSPAMKRDPEQEDRAQSAIRTAALLGTGAGMLPVPGLDIAALTGIHVKMCHDLADIYGVDMEGKTLRTTVTSAISSVATSLLSTGIARITSVNGFMKFFLGGMTNAALSGLMTAEFGQVYKQHFEAGGSLDDLSLTSFISHINEQIKAGEFNPGKFASLRGRFGYLFKN